MGIIDSLHVEGTAKTVGTIVVVLLAFYFFVVRKQTKGRIASKPAGGLPIIGHALKLEPAVMLDFFTDCWKAGGGNFEFSLVGKRVLVLTEWECIKDVLLRRPKVFTRGSGMVDWAIDLGITTGLFNIEGPVEWGRVRRLTAPSFAPHSIDSMFSVVSTESQTFLKDLTKAALQQKEDNRSIDGMKVCMQFTLRVIINLAFGSAVSQSQYLQSSDVLTDIESLFTWIHRRISIPLPTVVWKLYNDSLEKKAMNTSYMLDKAVSDIKQFYLEQCDSSNTSDKDAPIFLKTLLKSRSTGDSSGRKSDRDNLSDTDVAAQIKTFLIAGTETTAASISSAIQYLCDPAQERLVGAMYEETKNAFGDNDYPSTVEELQSLSLVTAFLKEALRLRGPAPCIFAEVSESEKSTNIKGGYQVNSPDLIISFTQVLGMDSDIFPDPQAFKPERWIDSSPQQLELMNERFTCFGLGPRVCPGQRLALMEAVAALSIIIRNFKVSLDCDSVEVKRIFTFTAKPSKLPIKLALYGDD